MFVNRSGSLETVKSHKKAGYQPEENPKVKGRKEASQTPQTLRRKAFGDITNQNPGKEDQRSKGKRQYQTPFRQNGVVKSKMGSHLTKETDLELDLEFLPFQRHREIDNGYEFDLDRSLASSSFTWDPSLQDKLHNAEDEHFETLAMDIEIEPFDDSDIEISIEICEDE